MDQKEAPEIFTSSVHQIIEMLKTDGEQGISSDEAIKRKRQHGPNAIREQKMLTPLQIILRQFASPIVYLLLFAAAVSFWFKEWLDGTAIVIVIVVNAAIGFFMEWRAQQSMMALRKMSSVATKVVRQGKLAEINSEDVVPGDLIFAEGGDMLPADGRIIRSSQFMVDESALTGESVPVDKRSDEVAPDTPLAERINMAYKGPYVAKGNAYVVVAATGMNTELGKIASLVESSEQAATPLEKKLEQFSKKLIKITVVLVVIIFGIGLINGEELVSMITTAIALAVAAIPEGLPIVATMSLAQGMLKMARHQVIVKKLSAVETLGGTNVICTDKTGTLTQNKMEVTRVEAPDILWDKSKDAGELNNTLELIRNCSILCNTADLQDRESDSREIGDPLEIALLKFAIELKGDISETRNQYKQLDEEPFSSDTKIMATLCERENQMIVFAKGAIEELLPRCSHVMSNEKPEKIDEAKRSEWNERADKMASAGFRTIAMAFRNVETTPDKLSEDLTLLGIIGMQDPPRPEVFDAIKECKSAGIKIIMITGDHPSTARHIAAELGITANDNVVTGKDMKEFDQLTEEEKSKWINSPVFARVSPKHKLDLVTVLQEKEYVVGMTGDGVNDAPALKKADIGIAMGQRGTQVAQEVADMILKDDSFSSIVVAIRQGRVIFENIKKFVTFLLSCNLSELFVIAVVAILNLHFQLFPLQILFINLITDVLPALALGITKGSETIMNEQPRKSSEPIISSRRWRAIIFYSGAITLVSLASVLLYHYSYHTGEAPTDECNNILFFSLILCQLTHVFNMGSGNFFRSEVFRNRYVWFSVALSLALVIGLIQIPLIRQALNITTISPQGYLIIAGSALCSVIIVQIARRLKIIRS